jgi:hypothetical protein
MDCRTWIYSAALLVAVFGASEASAEDAVAPQTPASFSPFDELRLGVFAHNPINDENAPVDASFEILTSPISFGSNANPWISAFINPRLDVGAMMNTGGRDSYGFAGLDWRFPLIDKLFFEGEFGGAVNNAPTRHEVDRVDLGCHETFRESGGFGYQITSNIDVVASVEHVSHADLCGHTNPGLTNFGLRLGYKF